MVIRLQKYLKLLILIVILTAGLCHAGMMVNPFLTSTGGNPSGGFIGNKSETTFVDYWTSSRQTHTSEYTTITPGQVSYIFYDSNSANPNPPVMTYSRSGIWDASGNLVDTSDACDPTSNGAIYRWTLASSYTLGASTIYKLGFRTFDSDWRNYVVSGGSLVRDNTLQGYGSCVASESSITDDSTVDSSNSMRIWASNDPDDW